MIRPLLTILLASLPLLATAQRLRTTRWESGMLVKGKKVGVWEYYTYGTNGQAIVSQRYDHTTNQLLFCRNDNQLYEAEITQDHWKRTALTQPPWFIGGHEALAAYTAKLNYPLLAEDHNVQGQVVVSFVIDTLGRVSGHHVVLGIGNGCNEEALRVSRTIPNTWLPGRLGRRAVPVRYELPFTFKLD